MSNTATPISTVTPIDEFQQAQVLATTEEFIQQAGLIFNQSFQSIPVRFDLIGATAGMYKVNRTGPLIRYNPYIFAKQYEESLSVTVPHEVAHYVTDQVYGLRNIRPHGLEWRAVMAKFGADASVTGNYDLSGVPQRTQQRHAYRCDCTDHQLTTRRHNKIVRRRARYECLKCGTVLKRVRA